MKAAILALVASSAVALDVPFVPQRKDTCGAACLAMVMRYWSVPVTHDEIAAELLEPALGGILGSRLERFARDRGFTAVAYEGDLDQARRYVAKGRPLIVALRAGRDRYHNVVVVGFDASRNAVLVHDPAQGARRRMVVRDFERRWAAAGHWTLLVLPARAP